MISVLRFRDRLAVYPPAILSTADGPGELSVDNLGGETRWTGLRARRKAFTLLELLIVIALMAMLIALAIPSMRSTRAAARRMGCLSNISQVNRIMLAYTIDSRGSFLCRVGDDQATLSSARGRERFRRQALYLLIRDPWLSYSGLKADSRILRCPASQHDSGNPTARTWTRDYSVSETTLIRPDYLIPDLSPPAWRSEIGAGVQKIDNVLFPSAKALMFEEVVWHAWPGVFSEQTDLRELEYWGTEGPISAAYADGSAAMLRAAQLKPAVNRVPHWRSSHFNTTEWGMLGRDR